MPYTEARKLVSYPVACMACHDPASMQWRVTRPGLMEGIVARTTSPGIPNYDVNKMATRQEIRAFVCGQCHVEYYFKGLERLLVYPWSKGLKAEEIQAYDDEVKFKDWAYAATSAPTLKAKTSTGFHAPQDAAHMLGESINFSQSGQIVLRDGKAAAPPSAQPSPAARH